MQRIALPRPVLFVLLALGCALMGLAAGLFLEPTGHDVGNVRAPIGAILLGFTGNMIFGWAVWVLAEARHRQRNWLCADGVIIESWFGFFEHHARAQFEDQDGRVRVATLRSSAIGPPGTSLSLRYHPKKPARAAAQFDLDAAWPVS